MHMGSASTKGLIKHADFIVLDLVCLQISFVLAYWVFHSFSNPYRNDSFLYQASVLIMAQLAVIIFSNSYSGIVRRGRLDDAWAVITYMVYVMLIALAYLFVFHTTQTVSRLQYGGTAVLFVLLDWPARMANRHRILRNNRRICSIALITRSDMLQENIVKISEDRECFISRIFLLDKKERQPDIDDIPVLPFDGVSMEELSRNWVDEVLIMLPPDGSYLHELEDFTGPLIDAGMVVNCALHVPIKGNPNNIKLKKIGAYKAFTANLRPRTYKERFAKRTLDVVGGLIGCALTGILYLFVAPAIYLKSPGPIFFAQERIGRNGKHFMMYKFRTMYPDAEERKAALLNRNKLDSLMMFKMDDDPRIIGSERKDRYGRPKGIGNFLRKHSIDEFPQFYNVLRGDMSLVGWRPCTPAEWNRYRVEHRIRASIKPGITGMWQISGRSNIVDFEEVVRYDSEYFENWTIGLDIRIILKTIWVALSGRGAA